MLKVEQQSIRAELTPATQYPGYEALVLAWEQNPKLWQYFRQWPPAFTWNSPALMAQVFNTHYLILHNGQPVGMCGVYTHEASNKKAEFSLLLDVKDKELRRHLSTSTIEQIESYVFDYLGYNKLGYKVLPGDVNSVVSRAAELGYEYEGIRKQDTLYKGKFFDEFYFVKFKETH